MDWAELTNNGTRQVNEDSLGVVQGQQASCFLVADGLGGHGMGDAASALAVAAFQEVFSQEEGTIQEKLEQGFSLAQERILAQQQEKGVSDKMKTTATVLAVTEDSLRWGHVGDTRLYAFAHNRVKMRTMDHSVPQMLVMMKEIRESEIRNHPDRNRLMRVLGVAGEQPRYELSEEFPRNKFSAFLICSDGFWELVLEREMEQCLKQAQTAQEWLEQMEVILRRRGQGQEMDNYTAVALILERKWYDKFLP